MLERGKQISLLCGYVFSWHKLEHLANCAYLNILKRECIEANSCFFFQKKKKTLIIGDWSILKHTFETVSSG